MIIEAANIKIWQMTVMGIASPFIGFNAVIGFTLGLATLIVLKGVFKGDEW